MTRIIVTVLAFAALFALLVLAVGRWFLVQRVEPTMVATPAAFDPVSTEVPVEDRQGFLYGRVTTVGATYEGRLRFGGDEEAFWGDYFDGFKGENPWAAHVPLELLQETDPLEVFGFEIWRREHQIELGRPFMARFGDIERVEASALDLRVKLKSGTEFELDRFAADDFADGVRVWDDSQGIVDFVEGQIRSIEFLTASPTGALPERLHGTVQTRQGDQFTGFLQWEGGQNVGTDELGGSAADGEFIGSTADGELTGPTANVELTGSTADEVPLGQNAVGELPMRFDTILSIARHTDESFTVTLLDGRQVELSRDDSVGQSDHGIYVDDLRYGRVLVSSDAFERVDLTPGGRGPAYDDYPPGQPLTGSVITRDGRRIAGTLVYDLDESETTETLDAPSKGVDYTIPFGLIASIMIPSGDSRDPQPTTVTLHSGEALQLERSGDLGDGNAGMLVFVDGREPPEYVPWADIEQVDLNLPPTNYPPLER